MIKIKIYPDTKLNQKPFALMQFYALVADCGSVPPAGSNSAVQSSTGTTYQSTVTYVCNTGYRAVTNTTLTCQANGSWSGNKGPNCTGNFINMVHNSDR